MSSELTLWRDTVHTAVEEAVRLRERMKDQIENITVVSIGPPKTADVLRTALAMGADSAIHVEVKDGDVVEPLAVAKGLKEIINSEKPDIVIMGKQAIDDDSSQVGGMLAGMLSWPQANFASKLDLDASAKTIKVAREIDGGLETLSMSLPAIVTTDLRLNEPRYASLPNIMKVSRDLTSPADLCIESRSLLCRPRRSRSRRSNPPTSRLTCHHDSRLSRLKLLQPVRVELR